MKWEITFSKSTKSPSHIEAIDEADLEAKVRAMAPNRTLEFDGFTDQVDVWSRRATTGRRDRFMILMAA